MSIAAYLLSLSLYDVLTQHGQGYSSRSTDVKAYKKAINTSFLANGYDRIDFSDKIWVYHEDMISIKVLQLQDFEMLPNG